MSWFDMLRWRVRAELCAELCGVAEERDADDARGM